MARHSLPHVVLHVFEQALQPLLPPIMPSSSSGLRQLLKKVTMPKIGNARFTAFLKNSRLVCISLFIFVNFHKHEALIVRNFLTNHYVS